MQTLNKVDWKRGMEIVPETFICADGYHDSVSMINRQILLPLTYGLVPMHDFELKYTIRNHKILLEKVSATIMGGDGKLFQLSQGVEVSLPSDAQGIYYLVVSIGEDKHKEENSVPYLEKDYNYQVTNRLGLLPHVSFPVMKLHADQGEWEVLDFIPPCCTVNSHADFSNLMEKCRKCLVGILKTAEERNYKEACYQLGVQIIDLVTFMQSDIPAALISRLKKIVLILKTYHLFDETNDELSNKADDFIWSDYSSYTLYETLQDALSFFHSSISFLEQASQPPTPAVENNIQDPEEEEITYIL